MTNLIRFSRSRGALYFCMSLTALLIGPQVFAVLLGAALALEALFQLGFWNKMTLGLASITCFSFLLTGLPTLNLALIGFLVVIGALINLAKPQRNWSGALADAGILLGFSSWHGVVWYSTSETGIIWFTVAFVLTMSSLAMAID